MEDIPQDSLSSALSFGSITGAIVFSGIGLWLFNQGRKNGNTRNLILGIVLMVYPLFIYNSWAVWGFGAAVTAYAYYRRYD
ncbi:MAG: hypothetical protein JSU04_07625 [Bdellovibrionales bacterium]|nr:hypothetical protein [Bdellovibrionales bacterium]